MHLNYTECTPYPTDTVEIERPDTPSETSGNSKEIQGLERLLKATEEQLADVKADRDEWRKQANQLLISNGTTPRKKFLGIF